MEVILKLLMVETITNKLFVYQHVKSDDDNVIKMKDPVVLVPGPKGFGLADGLMFTKDRIILMNKSTLMLFPHEPNDEIANKYKEAMKQLAAMRAGISMLDGNTISQFTKWGINVKVNF